MRGPPTMEHPQIDKLRRPQFEVGHHAYRRQGYETIPAYYRVVFIKPYEKGISPCKLNF
jgi:hypothetical protein